MNARTQEKRYGGRTVVELRAMIEAEGNAPGASILRDLLDEVELAPPREVADRLRRMETKLTRVAIKVGAEATENTTVTTTAMRGEGGRQFVAVTGYDVTLSMIRRAAVEAGLDTTELMRIVDVNDRLIGTMKLVDREG